MPQRARTRVASRRDAAAGLAGATPAHAHRAAARGRHARGSRHRRLRARSAQVVWLGRATRSRAGLPQLPGQIAARADRAASRAALVARTGNALGQGRVRWRGIRRVQRLWGRGRSDGAGGVRELRRRGRFPETRGAGRRGARSDRAGALRKDLSRTQGAQCREVGAAGVLIFSDPADDGFAKADPYPRGAGRPEDAIQRGSVQFLSEGPGDPTTPGWGSRDGAKRLKPSEVEGHPEDSLAADLVGRGAQDPRSARWAAVAGDLAGRDSAHLPRRARPGEAPHERGAGLCGAADLERDRDAQGTRAPRPVGDVRQSSRRVDLRRGGSQQRHHLPARDGARAGIAGEVRLAAAPLDRAVLVGWRGIRAAGLDGICRGRAPRSWPRRPRPT